MAVNPRVDFYQLFLRPAKRNRFKTFRNFAEDVLLVPHTASDVEVFGKLQDHFMSKLVSTIASDDAIKKQVRWLDTEENLYRAYKPQPDYNKNIIWGVLMGGRYGRNGLLVDRSNMDEDVNADAINPTKSVLRYFYFMLYLPLDHNEGCLIIHSNSREESSVDIFRSFLGKLFMDNGNYKKMMTRHYCPKYFQNLFKEGAVLKQMQFADTYIDSGLNANGIVNDGGEKSYDVKFYITPHNERATFDNAIHVARSLMQRIGFSFEGNIRYLTDANTSRITVENPETKRNQTFSLDTDEINLCPAIDLVGIMSENDFVEDGTPKIEILHEKMLSIFLDEVLPELRPDLED